jgi:uncharacterized protein YdeI (YjbR/CyaY-like superfamily)
MKPKKNLNLQNIEYSGEKKMGNSDKRVDTYIEKAKDFAKPILTHLRKIIHRACPDIEETIKWGFPYFEYKGGVCGIASFNQHCIFGFWKASLMSDPHKIFYPKNEKGMGVFGKLKSLKDLPSNKMLLQYIKEAIKLNEEGIKLPSKPKNSRKKEIQIPDYFLKILKKNKTAFLTFKNFSYTHQKEYIEWITEAKTENTRDKRITTAIEWMAEGKSRNWKYIKK